MIDKEKIVSSSIIQICTIATYSRLLFFFFFFLSQSTVKSMCSRNDSNDNDDDDVEATRSVHRVCSRLTNNKGNCSITILD